MATVTSKGDAALTNSIINRSITEIEDEMCGSVGKRAFINCSVLEKADFSDAQRIKEEAFRGCSSLNALILRKNSVCTFENNALADTPIANGDGYIYVLAEKVDATKGNCAYPNKVRAIEDYPEVCSRLGKVWKQSNVTSGTSADVQYVDNKWVMSHSDGVYTSTDAKTWTRTSSGTGYKMCYANGLWIHGRSGGIYYSEDLVKWTKAANTVTTAYPIVYENGMWQACTSAGIYYSEDGKTWTQSNRTTGTYYDVCYGNGIWVAAGGVKSYNLLYSEDGKTWTTATYPTGMTANTTVYDVRFVNNMFVIATGDGAYYSEDGKTWKQGTSVATLGLYFANGLWLAGASNGGIYYSEDGKTWTQSNVTSYTYKAFCYGNGVWVAKETSADSSTAYYSLDGKTWTSVRLPKSTRASCFSFGGGVFVMGINTSATNKTGVWYSE